MLCVGSFFPDQGLNFAVEVWSPNHWTTMELTRLFVFCCKSSLYVLDIIPFSEILFENSSSHSVGWLFILMVVSFTVQKHFSLM